MRKIKPSNRNAAIVVEFALVAPFFIFIALVTVDLCNTIYLKQTLKTAAFEGARTAIVPGANTYDIETKVADIAQSRNVSAVTVDISPTNFDTLPLGTFITIEVSTNQSSVSLLSQFASDPTVTASVSMMKEY